MLIGFIVGTILFAVLLAFLLLGFVLFQIVPLTLAILGGMGFSAWINDGGPTAGSTAIVAILLFLMLRSASNNRRRRRRQAQSQTIDAVATEVKAAPMRAAAVAPPPSVEPLLDTAFAALTENADWARSRVAVAQESCRLFLRLADRQPFDSDAGDLAVRIRKRVPEHIGTCIDNCEAATPSERRVLLEETVFTIEKVGAEADRQRARLMGPAAAAMDVQRAHLTRRDEPGPFSTE